MGKIFYFQEALFFPVPKGVGKQHTDFEYNVTINDRPFTFDFSWNAKHGYWSMTVKDEFGAVKMLLPQKNEHYLIEGFDARSPFAHDAIIGVMSHITSKGLIKKADLGSSVYILVMTGEVAKE